MVVDWNPTLLRVRTSTGETAAPEAPKAADAPAAPKKEETRTPLRGLELPRDLEKPVLVYFHWPHEDGARGKQIVKFCQGPLDDEAFVLLAPQFHCVEVNTRDSEQRLVDEAKVHATPALLVCRPGDAAIVWRTEDAGLSGKALAAALKKVLQDEFPARWAAVEKEAKAQAAALADARKLLAAGKTADATTALGILVGSDVRFTEEWSEARRLLREAEKKPAEDAK